MTMNRKGQEPGARPLRRKVATRKPRKTLVVFCEGERTEPEYLDALKRQPSVRDVAAVDLRVETGQGGSVPRTLVGMATAARSKAIDEDAEIDEFWCVFDVEWPQNHPGLEEAVRQARAELDRRHQLDGTAFPHDNPSSGMHRLLTAVEPPTE